MTEPSKEYLITLLTECLERKETLFVNFEKAAETKLAVEQKTSEDPFELKSKTAEEWVKTIKEYFAPKLGQILVKLQTEEELTYSNMDTIDHLIYGLFFNPQLLVKKRAAGVTDPPPFKKQKIEFVETTYAHNHEDLVEHLNTLKLELQNWKNIRSNEILLHAKMTNFKELVMKGIKAEIFMPNFGEYNNEFMFADYGIKGKRQSIVLPDIVRAAFNNSLMPSTSNDTTKTVTDPSNNVASTSGADSQKRVKVVIIE